MQQATNHRRGPFLALAIAGIFLATLTATDTSAKAAGMISEEELAQEEEDMRTAVALIEAGQFGDAITPLMNIYNGIGAGANALNYLGYAHRQLGHHDLSLQFYEEALELDPEHLQAHEYLGELYVQTGQLDDAAAQLETLTKLCGACAESEQLAAAISQAQAGEQHSALGTTW